VHQHGDKGGGDDLSSTAARYRILRRASTSGSDKILAGMISIGRDRPAIDTVMARINGRLLRCTAGSGILSPPSRSAAWA